MTAQASEIERQGLQETVPTPVPILSTLELPRTVFAAGALSTLRDELTALGVARPLLVTDKGVVAVGIAAKAIAAWGDAASITVFDGVTENPLFADVDSGAALYRQHRCDGVVALGGGSVIDTAKIVALLATNQGRGADYLGVRNAAHRAAAPLLVVPTTAGTGSEASPSAGIHPDASTASVGMNSRHLVPRVVILDPQLTRSLPRGLTAATGIDALSHCIEGYLSRKSVPLGDAIALDGIAHVAQHLRRTVADGADADGRGGMMLAAFAGGVSIGMGLGPAHAVAISCSDQGFPHGILSGIGLVATLDVTQPRVPERASAVARALGLAPGVSLSEGVASLMRDVGLPTTLAELGYVATDVDALAQTAHSSHFNLFAPVHPSVSEYAALLGRSLAQH
ncbi:MULTISPECIES: iron-containing alcohol dehydrogenase [unclassified Variovorax]|uniref:iron-containing alcohol dehydrogenase n=1 Tax=unclassified Variovorax TaxID=663243 RepID=UPI001BD65E10|nr:MULTISPECIES: iron-containing alcohol dehydrogenase [unclassified Variovorax]